MAKIFGTDGIRCLVNQEPLSPETCLKISKAVAYLLSSTKNKKRRAIICKDTRLSGYLYEPLVTAGFISMGIDVILVGPLPTPSLPLLIKMLRADIGVMITASHNTYEYNGLKFFDSNGYKLKKDIEKKIEKLISNPNKYLKIISSSSKSGKALRLEDSSGRYSEHLKSTLDKKSIFKKFKIVLDCANGATYQVAPNLFWELGHQVISINSNPDGTNINKNCGAVDVNELKKTVLKKRADIGFAFDGDGDRLIVVDEKGNEVDGDKIIALFAKHFIGSQKKLENKKVITTVMSNLGFEKYLKKELNISLIRTDVGDINVINAMQKNKSLLGGEQSGHIILSEYSNTGDGILAALKIIEIMSKKNDKTSKIFDLYKELPQKKINIKYKKINNNIRKKINSFSLNQSNNTKFYRLLIRFSGTEPLIRILVEGPNKKEVGKIARKFEDKVRSILV
tara:strand:- start:16 stop:1371 length:1356 start_codon:yes stop_codon:yes gene_type:complete